MGECETILFEYGRKVGQDGRVVGDTESCCGSLMQTACFSFKCSFLVFLVGYGDVFVGSFLGHRAGTDFPRSVVQI